MGLNFWLERIFYEIKKRTFIYRQKFPVHLNSPDLDLAEWKLSGQFIIDAKESLTFQKNQNPVLKEKANEIMNGHIQFFNGIKYALGLNYDWLTDPTDGYQYDGSVHWTKIRDFHPGRDIKYVWEKSRFCYLYPVIRYDYHFETDCSTFVIDEIISWIDHAPLNCGPQYISSQEIGLRIMNWCFFLSYYKNSSSLTRDKFKKIVTSIYQQAFHIHEKLEFSKKFVRNNHILTEAAALSTVAMVFPSFPQSANWKNKGFNVFEEEIKYQIYDDGTYLQYSTNYHRVAIQLLSWMFNLSAKTHTEFSAALVEKSKKSLTFLYMLMNNANGQLPNYGNNDGSLFFPLNEHDYRDFRPQLQLLSLQLNKRFYFTEIYEDAAWFGVNKKIISPAETTSVNNFPESGYHCFKDSDTFTFLRCGHHKHRPSQADNLHIDLWYENENIMRDAGTFQYNGTREMNAFYFGTVSHNTIQLGNLDQMLKGKRFIWIYWTDCLEGASKETETEWRFSGTIKAFRQTGKWIRHKREVVKDKNLPFWEITDQVDDTAGLSFIQIWNPSLYFYEHFEIKAFDENENLIQPAYRRGYYSKTYGIQEETRQIYFSSEGKKIKTIIRLKAT